MDNFKINNLDDLLYYSRKYKLPVCILEDVNRRVIEHLSTGGSYDDDYIMKQCKFVQNYIKYTIILGKTK